MLEWGWGGGSWWAWYIQREQICLKMRIPQGSSQALLPRVCDTDLCQADPSPLPDNTDTEHCAFSGQATHLPLSRGRRHQPHLSPTLQRKISLITCPLQGQELLKLFEMEEYMKTGHLNYSLLFLCLPSPAVTEWLSVHPLDGQMGSST